MPIHWMSRDGEAQPLRAALDPKTVRRYVTVAESTGLRVSDDPVSETQLRDVLLALHPGGGRPRRNGGPGSDTVNAALDEP